MARARGNSAKQFRLTRADKRIYEKYRETLDVRYVTGWYFRWEPHPGQLEWMNALLQMSYSEAYLTTGARWGKSEVMAIVLLLISKWWGVPVVNTSITQDQAEIVWTKAEDFLLQNPRIQHWIAHPIHHSPFPLIRWITGGEFGARSTQFKCKHIRGYSFAVCNYDEVAYGHQDDMAVLKLRVADYDGSVVGTTTPRAKNWYYRECWRPAQTELAEARVEGRASRSYTRQGPSFENPHISHVYLAEKMRLPQVQFDQEVKGEFVDVGGRPFMVDSIEMCTNADLNPTLDRLTKSRKGPLLGELKGGTWIVAWDLAKRADWTVGGAMRVDKDPWQLLWYDRYQHKPWPMVEKDIDDSACRFDAECIVDTTGVGDVTFDHLNVPVDRLHRCDIGPKLKGELITNLQWCLDNHKFDMPFILQIQNELFDYEFNDKGLETDCVMMLAILCWLACGQTPPMEML